MEEKPITIILNTQVYNRVNSGSSGYDPVAAAV
jgi:hypothetical protein